MDFTSQFLRLLASLNDHQVEYVLIGGTALDVHGLLLGTEDVDVPTVENIERLKSA